MKMFGDYKKAEALMQPGSITQSGFLGDDKRPLVDIIQKDEESFHALGLEWEEVTARLQYLQKAGSKGLGEPVLVDNKWLVQNFEARGKLPCPFGDLLLGKITTTVTWENYGKQLSFSEISIHLLAEHHFLQGKGSPFRLEPKLLKELLAAE